MKQTAEVCKAKLEGKKTSVYSRLHGVLSQHMMG